MTQSEIEIKVSVEVRKALDEVVPSVKKAVKEIEDALAKINMDGFTTKIQEAIQIVTKKLEMLKNLSKSYQIKINVNNKQAKEQIEQVQKQIEALQKQVNANPIKINIISEIGKEKQEEKDQGKKGDTTQSLVNNGVFDNIQQKVNDIGSAFQNIWNNENATPIIENLKNTFDNLLLAVVNVSENEEFQSWLANCSDKFRDITEKLSSIDWQTLIDALVQIGTTVGTGALDLLNGLVDAFKWIVENPILAEVLVALAFAIGGVVTAFMLLKPILEGLSLIIGLTGASFLPLIGIIAAVIAVIALIILIITHWDDIMKVLSDTWNWVCSVISEVINSIVSYITDLWSNVSFIFEAIWEVISTILGFIWDMFATVFEAIWNIVSPIIEAIWSIISTIFGAIWNIISTILGSVWNIFSQIFNWIWQLVSKVFSAIWNIISPIITKIWETIKFALERIKEIWSNVWNTISSVVNNIWNGIWNCIKTVINSILSGIEGMVNGVIKGVNFILKGISSIANAIGSLIGLDPINLQLNTVSLPRLAKGGVLTRATMLIAGEYAGANTNPEIVTPQNIMYDTMRKVLQENQINGNDGKPVRVQIYWGTKNVVDEIIDGINEKTRKTGKAQIKVSY